MFERLKKNLVDSFVGAIALGWIFAQGILHFADIFSAPFADCIMRREYPELVNHATRPTSFSLQDALPELARSVCLLALGYILLRWLYFKPVDKGTSEPTPRSEQAAWDA
jgi:hypothetical protein